MPWAQSPPLTLFTGNRDRLLQFNWESMTVSPYSLSMIDNIWMGTDMSRFRTGTVTMRDGSKTVIKADDALATWKADREVGQLAAGDYAKIAETMFDRIHDEGSRKMQRRVDQQGFRQAIQAAKPRFLSSFSDGLQSGKEQLVIPLDRLSYTNFHNMVQGVGVAEFRRMVKARRDFLTGRDRPRGNQKTRLFRRVLSSRVGRGGHFDRRPSGYEPDELPLLHPATSNSSGHGKSRQIALPHDQLARSPKPEQGNETEGKTNSQEDRLQEHRFWHHQQLHGNPADQAHSQRAGKPGRRPVAHYTQTGEHEHAGSIYDEQVQPRDQVGAEHCPLDPPLGDLQGLSGWGR